jgi:hypothetical protein
MLSNGRECKARAGEGIQIREGQARQFKARVLELYAELFNTYILNNYMQQLMTECIHSVNNP